MYISVDFLHDTSVYSPIFSCRNVSACLHARMIFLYDFNLTKDVRTLEHVPGYTNILEKLLRRVV